MTALLNFTDLLCNAGIQPLDVRLIRHAQSGSRRGFSTFDLWHTNREHFEYYQARQTERAHGSLKKAPIWASFVAAPNGKTMFVGCYEAVYLGVSEDETHFLTTDEHYPAGALHCYSIKTHSALSEYIGRLFIDWGTGHKAWYQRATTMKPITELLSAARELEFPGFLNLVQPLSAVLGFPETWKVALRSSRGIYLLTCPRTYELYVGIGSSDGGFYDRWAQYARDGHGGNIELRLRDPSNYQISILEVVGTAVTLEELQALESLWKLKLGSRITGMNRN